MASIIAVRVTRFFHRHLPLLLFIAIALISVALRIALAFRGHNYDQDSWQIVGDIALRHGNVYTSTYRYNYGPIWFLLLGGLRWLHHVLNLSRLGPESFHVVVVAFLSLIDLAIGFLLFRRFCLIVATVFLLNPLSLLLTGYHSQFDSLALLFGLIAWTLISPKPPQVVGFPRWVAAALLLGLSLATKHILLLFPIWIVFCPNLHPTIWKRVLFASLVYIVFVSSFVPFAVEADALHAITKALAMHGYSETAFFTRLVNLIFPPPLIDNLFGLIHERIGMKALFLIVMLIVGWIVARVRPEKLFECYLVSLVLCTSLMADQYLAIPLMVCAIQYRRFSSWLYIAIGTTLVQWSAYQAGVFPGPKPWWHTYLGSHLDYGHACFWLLILLIGMLSRQRGWNLLRRGLREAKVWLHLRQHRDPHSADAQ